MDYAVSLKALPDRDIQGAMLETLQAEKYWTQKPDLQPADLAELASVRERKAALKAEAKRRGIDDYDWTEPPPPRRLPG